MLKAFQQAHEALKPFANEILSVDISEHRISVHLRGSKFREMAKENNVQVTGTYDEHGYFCGADISETIHIHSLLQ